MKEGKKGSYTRCSPYAEVEAERSDCYSEVVRRAAEQFDLSPRKGKILSLFRPNGAAVMDQELQVRGKKVPLDPWKLHAGNQKISCSDEAWNRVPTSDCISSQSTLRKWNIA